MSKPSKKRSKPWWIKERFNIQLGTFYVAQGRMSPTAAKRCEGSAYGTNKMLRYETEQEYLDACTKLKIDTFLSQHPTP